MNPLLEHTSLGFNKKKSTSTECKFKEDTRKYQYYNLKVLLYIFYFPRSVLDIANKEHGRTEGYTGKLNELYL